MDELRTALELATDEELQDLTQILFTKKFNPLDYLRIPDPVTVQNQDRQDWIDTLEQRFRFLAADGFTVLKGKADQITYRQVLLNVCQHLKLTLPPNLSTTELEAEIFLSLLQKVWKKLSRSDRQSLQQRLQRSLSQASPQHSLSLDLQSDPLRLLLEGGTALAVSSVVRPVLVQMVAQQFAAHFAAYQVAKQALVGVPLHLQQQIVLQSARQGMALSAARYSVTRSVFAFLGSALWVCFFVDLGWRAIATNYGRVIPTVFALAQIRLTRSEYCFNPI